MTRYTYTGPLSAATLPDGTEIVLYPGAVVDLPAEPFTDDLAGLGRLAPVEDPPLADPPTAPKPKKGGE